MKIAISSSGKTLDSALDPRFGRCACFVVVDPADMSYEAFDNQSASLGGGAGIQAAQFLADQRVCAVITGHVGPNAFQMLSAAGIDIFAGQQGSVKEVVERYKGGSLKPTEKSTAGPHSGTGGVGFGSRGGRGMGRGRGLGMPQAAGRNPDKGSGSNPRQGKRS